jgi:hypothetical protein
MEGMNQFGYIYIYIYIYIWKCHKRTPCIAILNKQSFFSFKKIKEQESKTGPVWGLGTSGRGRRHKE